MRIANVTDLDLSPDGEYVVYSVGEPNLEEDAARYDLWRARWDGSDKRALTRTAEADEYQAAFSPDGKWIAFLSDRGDEDAETQVWIMPADGGEAEALTAFPGRRRPTSTGRRTASGSRSIANDPERPEGEEEPKQPEPIVIDRYYFKEDYAGWLTDKRQHLYLFEIDGKKATQLTSGAPRRAPARLVAGRQAHRLRHEARPRSGPPPQLRHLRRRGARRRARRRQVTRFAGADNDPSLESRPAWSPDGKRIAYLQAGEDKWIYYAPWSLAVIDVASGEVTRPAGVELLPHASRGSRRTGPRSSRSSRRAASRTSRASTSRPARSRRSRAGARFDYGFDAAANGRIAVLGGDELHPYRKVEASGDTAFAGLCASSPTTTSG